MRKIALIQSHCNTEEKLSVLRNNLSVLSNLGIDVLLFSHIPLPQDITEIVKYYIYDSTNPILWDERRHVYWWADNQVKIETSVPDYGWTVFNQIIKSYNLTKDDEYEMYFIVCYDLIIDEFVVDKIQNNKVGVYRHVKPKNVNEVGDYIDVIFDTSLIFISLTKHQIHTITSDLNKQEYIDHTEWIAEKYFEVVAKRNGFHFPNLGDVRDLLHESTSVFNQSTNPKYDIFIDTTKTLRFRYIKHDWNSDHYFVINNTITKVTETITFYDQTCDVYSFGVIIDGQYDNLLDLLKVENKINKIHFFGET